VEAVDETARVIGHVSDLRVLPRGRKYGQKEDYGHYDLIVGRNAETEVWPSILSWLDTGTKTNPTEP
jgi:hypothetical protein